ncbi:MAG: 3-oxoacyl-ACP reductase [Vampirovibrio sp.]|jgi:NAD(P)-dependent dehydrogenase (short-subunit alcohol dehydrogenase family)|nr:3-oxoacyl-ACP reductase [Vampirovibrio sp.]
MYMNKFKLTNRVAVVTGAGRGIGLATAEALADAGANVVLTDANEKELETAQAYLQSKNLKAADAMVLNVTDSAAVTNTADEVVNRHGKIDILVNNAGIARSETNAEDVEDEHWLNVIDVNLNGTFWCSRAFGRHMLKQKSGAIINVGSMSGFIVNRPQGQCYYNASKAAVHHLTKSLAAEWADRNVRVNAVAPTYIRTPLNQFVEQNQEMFQRWTDSTPMSRLGQPEEVASVILFLASDAASLMTGSVVTVDGGYTCW